MDQYYKIADLTVLMNTFGKTAAQAEPYRCQCVGQPDLTVQSRWERIKEQAPELSNETCEYISTGTSFYMQLLRYNGLLLHASAVMMDGWAYLFSADCGTGKSTHTQLWLKQFGDKAQILNDDKPALRLEDGAWYAYGTPWSGKTSLNVPAKVRLGGICVLTRGQENRIWPIDGKEAIRALISQTLRPRTPEGRIRQLELVDRLLALVPIWKMECNMDPQAAQMSYEAMSGGRKE